MSMTMIHESFTVEYMNILFMMTEGHKLSQLSSFLASIHYTAKYPSCSVTLKIEKGIHTYYVLVVDKIG